MKMNVRQLSTLLFLIGASCTAMAGSGPAYIYTVLEALILGALTVNPANRVCLWQGTPVELTATEFNMLVLLLRTPEQVVTKDTLSLQGVGRPREAYDRSVDVHICNLRQKLQQKAGEAVTIETVRSIGYKIL